SRFARLRSGHERRGEDSRLVDRTIRDTRTIRDVPSGTPIFFTARPAQPNPALPSLFGHQIRVHGGQILPTRLQVAAL
ncbi:MAG: hypothetical protein KDB22_30240, partial [Planctomycetales bacterium]|nr:hypothetical protein [Planctomycetales bacterium]